MRVPEGGTNELISWTRTTSLKPQLRATQTVTEGGLAEVSPSAVKKQFEQEEEFCGDGLEAGGRRMVNPS